MTDNQSAFQNSDQHPSLSDPTSMTGTVITLAILLLAGCSSIPSYDNASGKGNTAAENKNSALTATAGHRPRKGGGYYLDDGPGDNPPANLDSIPDAVPKFEPLRQANMRPYVAFGKSYNPMTALEPHKEYGIASWYGRRYHGNQTALGEPYDMYAMTAAHPTLPLPSYARITNTLNGKSVIVRINDRGPFLSDRVIDLSYTAAHKLDILAGGSGPVKVESILPPGTASFRNSEPKPIPPKLNVSAINKNTGVVYLQLGAFGAANNAHTFLSHIQKNLPWLSNAIGITEKNGLYKIHAGPYPNQILAQQAADSITQKLAIKPMVLID